MDVNGVDQSECTPLIWASRGGMEEVVDYLIGEGAELEKAGYGGMRALHHACNGMHEHAMQHLLDKGAEVGGNIGSRSTAHHVLASPVDSPARHPSRAVLRVCTLRA